MAIYGAGRNGRFLQWFLKQTYGITIDCFVDKHNAGNSLNNIRILSLDEFKALSQKDKYFVVVSITDYRNNEIAKIRQETKDEIEIYLNKCKIIRCLWLENTRIIWPYKNAWWNLIFENSELFDDVCECFVDELSKATMEEYFKVYILGQRYQGETFLEQFKYWGIDNNQGNLFKLSDQEVIVDVGAAWGDTIYQYIKCNLPFKKIIGVESDPGRQKILHDYINMLPEDIKDKIYIIDAFFGKGNDTIDIVLKEDDVSLILMDVEGAEMDVLNTGVETISRCRPVLSICAYHRWDDLIKIPKFIQEKCKDYVMVLRKYPSVYMPFYDGIQQANELVLYAIPIERYTGTERI